jgi:hypothetical protein
MRILTRTLGAAALLLSGSALLLLPQFASSQQTPGVSEPPPAFHAEPPKDKLPDTLEPSLFQEPLIFNSYTVAGRIKKVLYQQPCYCHCDRSQGHGSLLDCFVSHHASGCDLCQKEAFYAYEQTHKGRTPAQIREAIIRGDWKQVDLARYQASYLPPAAPAKQ